MKDNVTKTAVVMISDYLKAVRKETKESDKIVVVCYLEVINHFESGKTFKRYVYITPRDYEYYRMLFTKDVK